MPLSIIMIPLLMIDYKNSIKVNKQRNFIIILQTYFLIFHQPKRMHKQNIKHEKVIDTVLKQIYYICDQLGSGASSKVYLAVVKDTNKQVAIKAIPKQYLNSDKKLYELVKTQIYILKNCNNDNIVKCYDVFQSPSSIFLVMQYCSGLDMEQYVQSKKFLSQDNAVWYLKQILNGFKGLHEIGAMHRDFKLANLLLHQRVCKIADMGFAKQMGDEELTETMLGTQVTMAPEVLQRKPYGINADIWSLGVVFYQMLTGKYPYQGLTRTHILKNIKDRNKFHFEEQRISPLAKNFIQGCLTLDPKKRITWVQIYNHPLLNKQTIELTYGISNSSEVFFENQTFYRTQSFDESEDSLSILRNSSRKQVIIDEIQSYQEKAVQCSAAKRSSINLNDFNKMLIRHGIHYGTYLNKLVYPMKFINFQLVSDVPNIDHCIPLYLIYKKCYLQVKQFSEVMKRGNDIFKIQLKSKDEWRQFLKCSIYTDMMKIASQSYRRVEKIFQTVQKILIKRYSQKNQKFDQRVVNELQQKSYGSQFKVIFKQYVLRYAITLRDHLISKQKEENLSLIDLCEIILYYIDMDEKNKIKVERFDWNCSLPIDYKKTRIQLVQKFKFLSRIK